MSARVAREKMYEHASAILAKSSSSSQLLRERDLGVESAAHKSGEMELDMKPKGKKKYYGIKLCYIIIFQGEKAHILCVFSTDNKCSLFDRFQSRHLYKVKISTYIFIQCDIIELTFIIQE
jgi:hypothetical protein